MVRVSRFAGAKLRVLAIAVAAAGLGLAGCASVTPQMAARGVRPHVAGAGAGIGATAAAKAPRATVPSGEGGRYKLGAPYEAGGLWYVPAEDPAYDEVGIASWYGDAFDGKATANGERFSKYAARAAHATLPMPSIVEVTNLENGRTIRVRLNDRGPFKAGRIIDLSRGAAQELGYMQKGTAKVRVRYVGPARLDGTLEPLYLASNAKGVIRAPMREGPIVQAELAPPPAPADLPQAAPTTPPTPRDDAPAAAGYSVQAGAFSDRARAEKVAASLSGAGAAAIRPVEVASRQLYRVVVGPWRDEDQARAAREQVASLGFADARVIRAF